MKKKNAIGFVDRGIRKEINFIPEIAAKECWDCKECFPLCPTEALQAAFVLVEALAFPEAVGQGVGPGFTQRIGLGLAAAFGNGFGEIGKQHGEP